MSGADPFFDTSVLLYLLSDDTVRADRVETLHEVREILDTIRAVCTVEPITVDAHDRGLAVFERYRFPLYDSILVATALISGAKILYSEDLQHGQVIANQLRATNPF
jgi:predicted nucleic acid-binding protein